jgi:hypothetical protein
LIGVVWIGVIGEPAQAVGAQLYAQNKVLGMLFVLAEYITADLPEIRRSVKSNQTYLKF